MTDMPKAGEFCWNELTTGNVQSAKEFYGNVFGWTFTDLNMGEATYTIIQQQDKKIGGMFQIPKGYEKEMPPHWMAYILVDNVDTAVDKACKQGAKVIRPVSTAGEMGRFAVIADPTGAHIALWQATKM